jgi:hypothetical protein
MPGQMLGACTRCSWLTRPLPSARASSTGRMRPPVIDARCGRAASSVPARIPPVELYSPVMAHMEPVAAKGITSPRSRPVASPGPVRVGSPRAAEGGQKSAAPKGYPLDHNHDAVRRNARRGPIRAESPPLRQYQHLVEPPRAPLKAAGRQPPRSGVLLFVRAPAVASPREPLHRGSARAPPEAARKQPPRRGVLWTVSSVGRAGVSGWTVPWLAGKWCPLGAARSALGVVAHYWFGEGAGVPFFDSPAVAAGEEGDPVAVG